MLETWLAFYCGLAQWHSGTVPLLSCERCGRGRSKVMCLRAAGTACCLVVKCFVGTWWGNKVGKTLTHLFTVFTKLLFYWLDCMYPTFNTHLKRVLCTPHLGCKVASCVHLLVITSI